MSYQILEEYIYFLILLY